MTAFDLNGKHIPVIQTDTFMKPALCEVPAAQCASQSGIPEKAQAQSAARPAGRAAR